MVRPIKEWTAEENKITSDFAAFFLADLDTAAAAEAAGSDDMGADMAVPSFENRVYSHACRLTERVNSFHAIQAIYLSDVRTRFCPQQ